MLRFAPSRRAGYAASIGGAVAAPSTPAWANTYSLDFDGTNDYLDIGDVLLDGVSAFTVTTWVKCASWTGIGDTTMLVSKDGWGGTRQFYWAVLSGGTTIRWYMNDGSTYGYKAQTHGMSNSTWHHIALTYDGSAVIQYVDGVALTGGTLTGSVPSSLNTTSNNLQLGGQTTAGAGHYFNGKLDETAIWDEALTAAEILALKSTPSDLLVNAGNYASKDNLVGWWRMEENTGTTVADSSTNSNTATLTNGPTFSLDTPTLPNYSIDFDGTNDYLAIADHDDFSFGDGSTTDSPFSISAWIYMDEATKFRLVAKTADSDNREWLFTTTAGDDLGMIMYDLVPDAGYSNRYLYKYSNASLVAGQWYHVAMTYSGNSSSSGINLYVDGSAVATTTADLSVGGAYASMHNHAAGVSIGAWHRDTPEYANGKIDDVAIWSVELDADAITAIYNSGVPTDLTTNAGNYDNSSSLIGWWRMNENTGTTVADSSTNSHTATLTNGPTFSTDTP